MQLITNYQNYHIYDHVGLLEIFCIEPIIYDWIVSHPSTLSVSEPATGVVLSASVEIIQILEPTINRIPWRPCCWLLYFKNNIALFIY